jgi:YesN/AraC family two-component response regulator
MGPVSKEAICNTLGHLIDELQQHRALQRRIETLLTRQAETDSEGLIQVNRRVTQLEIELRGHAAPAE